ncbi:unnamed protein product [Jaminaea pallidilutea]
MPLTLKLGRHRQSQGGAGAAGEAASPSASPARTVSFSERPSYAPPSQSQQSTQLGFASSAGQDQPANGSAPAASADLKPAAAQSKPRRPRSPTPPSSAVSHCLAGPAKRKRRRKNGSISDDDDGLTQVDARLTLYALIQRYAKLAGFEAVEQSVLDHLVQSLECYLQGVALYASRGTESGGRMLSNVRDLTEAIWATGVLHDEEDAPFETRDWYVAPLVEWRHKMPDYTDEYAHIKARRAFGPPNKNQHRWSQATLYVQALASSAESDDDDRDIDDRELLSTKSLRREKLQRSEIPAHLPELPALHTWRKTDSYPTNNLLADVDGGGLSREQADAKANGNTSTLSRLESRLLSSRLVQTSLSSLIGRLDEAATATVGASKSGASTDRSSGGRSPAGASTTAESNKQEGTAVGAADSSSVPTIGKRKSMRERSASTLADTSKEPGLASAAANATPSRMSIRLRTGSTSTATPNAPPTSASGAVASTDTLQSPSGTPKPTAVPLPSSNLVARRGLIHSNLHLDTNVRGLGGMSSSSVASPSAAAASGTVSPRSGGNAALHTPGPQRRSGLFAGSGTGPSQMQDVNGVLFSPSTPFSPFAPSVSAAGVGAGGTARSRTSSVIAPFMTPATPTAAGAQSGDAPWPFLAGGGGGRFVATPGAIDSPLSRSRMPSLADVSTMDVAAAAGEGAALPSMQFALPSAINYKASWYSRAR